MDKIRRIKITRYSSDMASEWNAFIAESRNATFLFNRGYMDYHADRYNDHSLIAAEGERIIALLPAEEYHSPSRGKILRSHGGLTYGGWAVRKRHTDASDMLEIFSVMMEYCRGEGFSGIDYKPLPYIYSVMPADDDLYALYRSGASLQSRNLSCAIDYRHNPGFNTQQRRNLKRSAGNNVIIELDADINEFHRLLSDCLKERHDAAPVHTVSELQTLKERFPENIRLYIISVTGEGPQAGVCIFDTGIVAHAQYIWSTPSARQRGLLTRLFDYLIKEYSERNYFDFGTNNEAGGMILNSGLYRQKFSLGGGGVAYDRYYIDLMV